MKRTITAAEAEQVRDLLWQAQQHVQQLDHIERVIRLVLHATADEDLVADAVAGGYVLERLAAEGGITLPEPTKH